MIVTISTMNIYYGVLQLLSAGNSIYVFPEWFKKLGAANIFSFIDKNGFSSGLSLLTVFCAATVLITFLMLSKTKIGRQICAIGGNQQAASRVGISLKKLHLVCLWVQRVAVRHRRSCPWIVCSVRAAFCSLWTGNAHYRCNCLRRSKLVGWFRYGLWYNNGRRYNTLYYKWAYIVACVFLLARRNPRICHSCKYCNWGSEISHV